MLRLAWRTVRHNAARYVATLVAIATGVAFFAASGFVTDGVIDALEGNATRVYGAVDVAIVPNADAGGADFADDLRLGGDAVEQIRSVAGVDAVAGVLTGKVAFLGPDGKAFATSATGRLWIDDDELNPLDLVEGRAPATAGEIAVDRGTADTEGFTIGQQATILTLAGPFPVEVVGITRLGDKDAIDSGGTVSLTSADAFEWLNRGHVEYEQLYVRGSGSQTSLRDAVAPQVPAGFRAETGAEFLADQRSDTASVGETLQTALQAFSLLAMLVGGFVIFNTFNVIVAQRVRELAVLAAIGATPAQIKRSMRVEALVIGLLGSCAGIVAGIGMSYLLRLALGWLGIELSGAGIVITPVVIAQGIVAGILITYASAMLPARNASRVEPIEAMRQASADPVSTSRTRRVWSLLLMAGGAGALLFGSGALVALAIVALFVGTIVAGPLIATYGSRLLRPVLQRMGLEGRLAVDNTVRNPRRTATTANALFIGVFLVTVVTVAGTGLKDWVVAEINALSSADYTIRSTGGTIDEQLVADLQSIDGVDRVVPFRQESVSLDDEPSALATGDLAALIDIADITALSGSLDDLGPGTIAVLDNADGTRHVGDTVTLAEASGARVELSVVAVVKMSIDTLQVGNLVDTATFDAFVGRTAPTMAFLGLDTGEQTKAKEAIEDITDLRPDISVIEGNLFGKLIGTVFDFLINAVNGLLMMSVLVALIGIVNTLSLSILERRRELGLLRVVGMVDRRVHRMVRMESLLISVFGTVEGVVVGTFVGVGLIRALGRVTGADVGASVPWSMLAVVLVVGAGLGAVASFLPARRSTRLDVLEAIQAT